jgi:hypothetical protein
MQTTCRYRLSRAALAVVAAYALALQALLAGAAGAAQLSGRHGEAGWLCIPAETGAPAPSGPARPHAADCCLLACHAAPLGCAATPSAAVPAQATSSEALLPARAAFAVAPVPFLPFGPRAPPLLG